MVAHITKYYGTYKYSYCITRKRKTYKLRSTDLPSPGPILIATPSCNFEDKYNDHYDLLIVFDLKAVRD